ncbi:glycosyltransferase family 4 protein [Aestuariispira insulae]|uniref:Glycosyltransferase involved in cell wall biosynthesis n=1 Tax=Aestuariispira insulae TaxID=1461337 RepID=A0A3D9H2S9_9PROT|nr:glycosyltransferase family 4 protein [Aestuariispira insulae]RED43795.1 glycosyltransferase involved in cell wall biosynthesis [Aestuariispira insulae]
MKPIALLLDSRSMGGIETHVSVLAKELTRRGFRADVSFLRDYGPHPMDKKLNRWKMAARKYRGSLHFLWSVLTDRPALIHTHGYKAGLMGRLAARLAGVPVVSTYHSGDPGTGRVRCYSLIDQKTAWLAQPIAVSEEIAKKLPPKTRKINNFVPMPAEATAPITHFQKVAFVGRLSEEKGPDRFCELASLLPNIQFEMIGDGPMRDELQEKYGQTVRFRGAVSDMDDLWPEISLLCMPSRKEGLPMAALEAMACGIPVAAFAVGGLPELIRHEENGYLAANGDTKHLAALIQKHANLASGSLKELSCKAAETIANRYPAEKSMNQILEAYHDAGLKL